VKLLKVKRWHWALIAVLAGAGFAFSHQNPVAPIGVWSLTAGEFTRQAQQKPWSDRAAFVDDITVHPIKIGPDGKKTQLVTMARWTFDKLSNQWVKNDCAFEAAVPFVKESPNGDLNNGEPITVLGFLDHARILRPSISYHYAWWERPNCVYCIAIAASLLLIAGILPTVIQIAAAAGASPSNQVNLPTPSAAIFSHVEEPAAIKAVEPEIASTVPELATEPLANVPIIDNEQDIKHFGGEFYPVEFHGNDSTPKNVRH
jgi:hypothetical protein